MTLEKLIQPMELVISTIHCLRERKGSSAKDILKYLEEKYDVSAETLKKDVEAGLRRGVSFGLINQKGGLYQLNEILRSPVREPRLQMKKSEKLKKNYIKLRKLTLGKLAKKIKKKALILQNRKKKPQTSKAKKVTKKGMKTRNSRRLADAKRRKLNRPKYKTRKTQKLLKERNTKQEVVPESDSLKNEGNNKV